MELKELFAAMLGREAAVSRRALERVPEERRDWKPHERSMPFGRLATLVATMPSWIAMMIDQDQLDLQPPGGPKYQPKQWTKSAELLQEHDEAVASALQALRRTSDRHLMTPWQLLVAGRVVAEAPRQAMIADTFTHLAHHRGQLSVYLRLNDVPVPSLYGPSADDESFA